MITRRRALAVVAAPAILKFWNKSAFAACAPNVFPAFSALSPVANYPDPFLLNSGVRCTTKAQWAQRRIELLNMQAYYWYGYRPPPSPVTVTSTTDTTMGNYTQRVVQLATGPGGAITFTVNLYIPNFASGTAANGVTFNGLNGPYPLLLSSDQSWDPLITPFDAGSGLVASIGPTGLATTTARGYIMAEFGRDDFSQDPTDQPLNLTWIYGQQPYTLYPLDAANGVTGYQWGMYSAQAWGYSRVLDYLATLSYVDQSKIACTGHSRGGGVCLQAGIYDTRIKLCIVNQDLLPIRFPVSGEQTWFGSNQQLDEFGTPGGYSPNMRGFTSDPTRLPIDMHEIIACVAPRACLINSATQSLGEAPQGQSQLVQAARPVWQALGNPSFGGTFGLGLFTGNTPHQQDIAYFQSNLDFADMVFLGVTTRSAEPNAVSVPNSPTDYLTPDYTWGTTFSWTTPTLI